MIWVHFIKNFNSKELVKIKERYWYWIITDGHSCINFLNHNRWSQLYQLSICQICYISSGWLHNCRHENLILFFRKLVNLLYWQLFEWTHQWMIKKKLSFFFISERTRLFILSIINRKKLFKTMNKVIHSDHWTQFFFNHSLMCPFEKLSIQQVH
jgi:hypothetical protein